MNLISTNNANYILRLLEAEGINYFFMVPGKLINPIMSCYNKQISSSYVIRPIVAAHEAGATAMADGYARATGHFGVCIVIDGPGTTNAVPMLTAAQADRSSVLLIAGQIPRDFRGMGAIQDTTASGISTVDMLKTVCNKSIEISHTTVLPRFFKSAIRNIIGINKGTGYISISKDILLEEQKEIPTCTTKPCDKPSIIDINATDEFVDKILSKNQKVIILTGSHCNKEKLYYSLKEFSEKYSIPVATTISSKGLFDEEHPNFIGLYGYSGHERAFKTISSREADVILLLGFDATQWTTLAWHPALLSHKNLFHIDQRPSLIGEYVESEGIIAEPETFLKYLDKKAEPYLTKGNNSRKIWLKKIRKQPLYTQDLTDIYSAQPIHPALIVQEARSIFPIDTIAVADAGVHRSYAAHYWKTYGPYQFFAATKYAPMGWAVPASIGIKLACPEQRVVTFTGDGCMLMSGLEIQTAAKLNLDITFIVFNNGFYGASYFNNIDNEECLTKIPLHNWALIAEGLGVKGFRVTEPSKLRNTYKEALANSGTKLIDIVCNHTARAPFKLYAETLKTQPFM